MSARLVSFDQKRTELTPGTVLVREWERKSQRVMVMADGFAWNGQNYDSLSKVAFAITGTKWNGPRFFGLEGQGRWTGHRGSIMKSPSVKLVRCAIYTRVSTEHGLASCHPARPAKFQQRTRGKSRRDDCRASGPH